MSKPVPLSLLVAQCAGGILATQGAEFTVTRTNISGPGSLQAVVAQVNSTPGSHTIRFGVTGKITLATSLPEITKDVVIEGREDLSISGGGVASLFRIGPGITAQLLGLTLEDGYSANGGAAIWNHGNLTVRGCLIAGSRGGIFGGAVYNSTNGVLTIAQSTLTNNTASPGWGGAIWNSGDLTTIGTTLVANTSKGGDGADASFPGGGGAGFGGALFMESGVASLSNCTFSANQAVGGRGGVGKGSDPVFYGAGGGPLKAIASAPTFGRGADGKTFGDGLAAGYGGGAQLGVYTAQGGSGIGGAVFARAGALDLVNCTVVSNRCLGGGLPTSPVTSRGSASSGGVHQFGGTVNVLNTIVQQNAADASPDLRGTFVSGGYNLIGNNAGANGLTAFDYQNELATLGPLQDNGGFTWTHAPLPGSTVIDAGDGDGAPSTDQRGVERPQGTAVDIGAVEYADVVPQGDSDGDGLTDADETNLYHTNPNLADTDGDSFSDGFEVKSGTDPKLASSVPEVVRLYPAVELEIFTNLGRKYQLEASTDLVNWAAWGASFDGVGGKSVQLVSTKGTVQTYWRLKRLP